ncbi:MAG: ATP-binding protein [Gemmatimonadota bacterium]
MRLPARRRPGRLPPGTPDVALRLLPPLLLLPAFVSPAAFSLGLAIAALPLAYVAARREEGVLSRAGQLLVSAAVVLLLLHNVPLLRGGGDRTEGAAETLSRAVGERLEQDVALLRGVAASLGPRLPVARGAEAFDLLASAFRDSDAAGRGLKLFAPEGALVAWYGKTLDGLDRATLVPVSARGVSGSVAVSPDVAGAVLRTEVGRWNLVLDDPWLRLSPVEALGLPHTGWLSTLEARLGVRVDLERARGAGSAAASSSVAGAPPGSPLRLGSHVLGRVRVADPTAEESGGWLRAAALCLLLALTLLMREGWCAADRWARRTARASGARAELAGLGIFVLLAVAFRWIVELGGLLSVLLPGSLSSPSSFASRALGPFTSSPADLLLTAAVGLLVALAGFRLALRLVEAGHGPASSAGAAAVGGPAARLTVALVALLALGVALQGPLARAGALLVRDTSTELLFRANLYSSVPGGVLFAGYAAIVAVLVLSIAAACILAEDLEGAGRRAGPAVRTWPWAAGTALLAGVTAAVHLRHAGPDASAPVLGLLLWALALAAGLAVAGLARAPGLPGGAWSRRIVGPALLAGLAAGLAVTTAHGAGRLRGLRQFMADRLEEVALPSNQWLEYNLRITSERLTGSGEQAEDVVEGSETAAFLAWTRTPLRDLPFPSALLVTDAEGALLSRFSLLPSQDLDLLPRIARAALRAPPEQIGRVQTETGRMLFFTSVPLGGVRGRGLNAVAVASEALEPSSTDEAAAYVLRNVFSTGQAEPFLFALHRGATLPAADPALTLASGEEGSRIWISVPLEPYVPDALDYLSLCLTLVLAALALFLAYELLFGAGDVPWPTAWRNPLGSFRGRVFGVLLAFVVLPLVVYSWISFQTTRHEIDQATRALAEEALRAAAAFLEPRLQAGGEAALEAILPEAARLVGQDLVLYEDGVAQASNRPEIFLANLFSRRMPGDLYRQLAFGGERLVTERARLGAREVFVAYLRLPASAGRAYVLGSPLLLREVHILRDQRELLQVLFVMFALSLLALGIFGWLVSRQLSSPLGALKEGADRIARGDLAHRLHDPERSDEFGRLFSAFNTMAAGLQVSQGELLAEKGKVQAILSSIGTGVVALDREGRVQLANATARELLDLSADPTGRRPAELRPAEFWDRAARALKVGRRREEELRLANGEAQRTLHLTFAPLVGEGGERRGLVVVFEDLSGVLASQRALAWEEMARQVAHEIKNPLTPIKLALQHLQRLQRKPPSDMPELLERNLDLVLSEIGRLERIAGEFSRFGSDGPGADAIDPEPAVREVVDLYARQDGDLRVQLDVRGTAASVCAEQDGLKKVLVNLLENAREAMQAGAPLGELAAGSRDGSGSDGSPGAGTREGGGGGRAVDIRLDYDAGPERALLTVRDRGPGIPLEHLERLFEPYFSTKTRGTGLGLAIARRLVESWGGAIEARNWDGGAEVLLWLEKRPLQLDTAGGPR